jgi:hypothetical protein
LRDPVFPKWLFSIVAVGGWVACGIFIGIMSVEGISMVRVLQAVGFGILGGLMTWGAVSHT